LPAEQMGDEDQRDHHQTTAQVRQDELGQQGHGALAGLAQVAAHADNAVEDRVDERAGNPLVRFDEGRVGRTATCSPSLLLYCMVYSLLFLHSG